MRIGNNYRGKEISKHRVNRKADIKLDYVFDIFHDVAVEKVESVKKDFLSKTLTFSGFCYLNYLNLSYEYENRLWAFNYNLRYKTSVRDENSIFGKEKCVFAVTNIGKTSITDAEWRVVSTTEEHRLDAEGFLLSLNNRMIIDRIVALDLTKTILEYSPRQKTWEISCTSLIGSTTWILIPPVTQLIKPSLKECAQLYEFLEMVLHVVNSKSTRQEGAL